MKKNMKKIISLQVLIIMLLLSFTSCEFHTNRKTVEEGKETVETETEGKEDAETIDAEKNEQNDEDELAEYLISPNILKTPNREYGVEEFIIINSGNLLAHALYPKGDLKELDDACKNWIEEVLNTYQNESESTKGEMVISYNSYVVQDQYVVVEFNGEFYNPSYAHPVLLSASFNADLNTGKVLAIEDFLKDDERKNLKDYVMEVKNLSESDIDEELLNNWMILDNGVEIVLEKGKYLPESDGTVRLLATYETLRGEEKGNEVLGNEEASSEKKELSKMEEENLSQLKNNPVDIPDIEGIKDKKVIAITFDDGPGAHTTRLLDILKANNVKATFFVLGSQIDTNPALLTRMVTEGHEIGGHSWTHRSFTTLSDEELKQEIMQTRAKIASITGSDPLSVRPPYGAYNERVKNIGRDLGVHFVNWNVDPLDWKTLNSQATYDAIVNTAANGNIVLSHDIHASTVDAMERIIPKLIEEGYHFVTVSEILTMGRGEIQAGEVYFSMYK